MLLDPEVERRKFDREAALLAKNTARLQKLGAFVVRAERPEIDVVLVPRLPLRVLVPVPPSGVLITPVVPTFQMLEIAGLSGRPFGVRVDLRGYDQTPPSITFRDPASWDIAPFASLPVGQLVDGPAKAMAVVLDGHPVLRRPFLCLRGVREYHEHPQHDGDDWAMYRASTNVYVLLERLARITLTSVRPQFVVGIAAPGQLQMQLNWAAEVGR